MSKRKLEKKEKEVFEEAEELEIEGGFTERLGNFIQKNRSGFLWGLGVVIVGLLVFIAATSIMNHLDSKALVQVEAFQSDFDKLRVDINNEEKADEVQALLDKMQDFAPKHKGYAGAQTFYLIGELYADQKNWAEAEKAWTSSASAGVGTYLEAVSTYNAGVAFEEQDKIGEALDLYAKVAGFDFPAAARAQFAIGRLNEAQNNKDAALAAYQVILSKWPDDQVWSNLAQSRIVALSLKE